MQAVEFEADIQNGMIFLPKEFERMKSGHLRVIALFQDNQVKAETQHSLVAEALDFPDNSGPFDLNWESIKLSRDEMNER
jgi:hypothetical protein